MERLNHSLFLLLNAAPGASGIMVDTAIFFAYGLIWLVPIGLFIGWLWGSSAMRQIIVAATVSGLVGLLINQLIGLAWYHPRPFEAGIGQTLVPHVQDSSFPSDHLTLIWAIAFSLLLTEQFWLAGWLLVLMGMLVAWARIYLGVHFPLDMLGAALVALGSVWLILLIERRLIKPLMPMLLSAYQTIFAGLIRKGWVKK